MKTKTKRILWLTPLAIAVGYVLALVGLRSEPSGYVASYSIFPLDGNDVLDFSRGTVTLRTRWGDKPCGTYSRSPDGAWIWHFSYGTKLKAMLVQSRPFSMSFTDTDDPSNRFTLRRRVFTQIPL